MMIATPPVIERIERQEGVGEAVTSGRRYPLSALTFVRSGEGRGLVSLQAGTGKLDLAGGEADDLGEGRWRLHIDRMSLLKPEATQGTCELQIRRSPPGYVSLSCRIGRIDDPHPLTVQWRGDGSAAVRLR